MSSLKSKDKEESSFFDGLQTPPASGIKPSRFGDRASQEFSGAKPSTAGDKR
jgi:hypothetical protein